MRFTSLAVESLFSRMSSPVPVVKLLVCNRLASLLELDETKADVVEALVKELQTAKFESEVTELLAIPLLARKTVVDIDRLRKSIRFPSLLSDSMLSLIGGRRLLVESWISSHSGPAPSFHPGKSLEILRKAQIIPPFVGHRLASLEKTSGAPFLTQWCFEFDSLDKRTVEEGSSHFMHFSEGDHEHKVGQFVSITGQRARSAYLRTLAIAAERWGMPAEFAEQLADAVRPVDSRLLGFVPTKAPEWSNALVSSGPLSEESWTIKIREAIDSCGRQGGETILHADFLVGEQKKHAAQLEVTTAYSNRDDLSAEDVFASHDQMPGQQSYDVEDWFTFQLPAHGLPGGQFVSAVIPLADDYLGLFNCDLMARLPHGPRLFARGGELRTQAESNRLRILSGSQTIGQVHYWNRNWAPTHLRYLKPNCGVATTVTQEFASATEQYTRMKRRTFWRLNIVDRQGDYGDWNSTEILGEVK
jgi:hypothetical protein